MTTDYKTRVAQQREAFLEFKAANIAARAEHNRAMSAIKCIVKEVNDMIKPTQNAFYQAPFIFTEYKLRFKYIPVTILLNVRDGIVNCTVEQTHDTWLQGVLNEYNISYNPQIVEARFRTNESRYGVTNDCVTTITDALVQYIALDGIIRDSREPYSKAK